MCQYCQHFRNRAQLPVQTISKLKGNFVADNSLKKYVFLSPFVPLPVIIFSICRHKVDYNWRLQVKKTRIVTRNYTKYVEAHVDRRYCQYDENVYLFFIWSMQSKYQGNHPVVCNTFHRSNSFVHRHHARNIIQSLWLEKFNKC